jgi:hypothetical protein
VATRSKFWVYKGPALVAQASRIKEAIGDEKSVRAAGGLQQAAASVAEPAAPLL